MKKNPFRYIFRFCCDPGFNDAQEIPALLRYVDEADIDDVAVFANVEEINTGHMTFNEQNIYLKLMHKIKTLLQDKGVTISVNQWHSIMHADLGKTLRVEQPFRLMVDIAGNQAKLCVCPLCAEWQKYIAQLYARYAKLEPAILWVEDDFRLHNHDPLVWGGCFCSEHMNQYSARAGKTLTREEFLKGVLQPGIPHAYRKIWLDVSRETILSAAAAIAKAVRAVSQQVKVGLMSSVPQVHAAEGRDWHMLLRTLSTGQLPVNRIHLPAYQEKTPANYLNGFNMVSMLTRAMIPLETEVYPELENYPYSLFSKSRRFTRFQLLSALPLNPRGLTIDLYDLNGNGIVWDEGYQQTLRKVKPFLNALSQSSAFKGEQIGVRILYNPDSVYTLHTRKGISMEELYPHESFFAGLLPAMGIPYAYTDHPEITNQIVAISGQALRNWNNNTLTRLFSNNFVILNGDAAYTLCDMGLGHLAGIKQVRWMLQNSGAYAYEQVTNGNTYRGRKKARSSAIISCSDMLDVTYSSDVEAYEMTAMYDSYRRRRAHGQVITKNRVLIYPFGRFEKPTEIPPMLLNGVRQAILQDVLRSASAPFPIVINMSYIEPYCFEDAGKLYIYLVNGSTDDTDELTLALPPEYTQSTIEFWRSETEDTAPRAILCKMEPGMIHVPVPLPSMETILLRLSASGFNP